MKPTINQRPWRLLNLLLAALFIIATSLCAPAQTEQNSAGQNRAGQPAVVETPLPTPESAPQNPNVSYEGMIDRWGTVIEKKTDITLYEPYQTRSVSNLTELTGTLRVRYSTEFSYDKVTYTGRPTLIGIFPGGKPFEQVFPKPPRDANGNILPPIGLRYPSTFDSDATRFNSLFEFGTQGLFWQKLSTFVSFQQQRSLQDISEGSPFLSLLQTYGDRTGPLGNGIIEDSGRLHFLNAYGRISNLGSENWHVGLKLGRQFTDFSENLTAPSAFDGGTLTLRAPRVNATFYAGRRWSFFADPVDRFLTGGAVSALLPYKVRLEYSISYYVRPKQVLKLRRDIFSFDVDSYISMLGDTPIDAGGHITKTTRNGQGYLRFSFNRKLSDKDYVFDQFLSTRYQGFLVDKKAPFEGIRLYLRPPRRANDYAVNGEYFLKNWLGVGGDMRMHRLSSDMREELNPQTGTTDTLGTATPWDTAYTELAVHTDIIPKHLLNTYSPRFNLEFRQRTFRLPAFQATDFFTETQGVGVSRYREFVGQAYVPINQRWSSDFTFYRRSYNFRNRTQNKLFTFLTNSSAIGVATSVGMRINQYNSVRFSYSFDTDYAEFNPDIQNAHQLRVSYRLQF